MNDIKGYILDVQMSMCGHQKAIGFGSAKFYVKKIPRDEANAMIVENHYSKKFYAASYIHLGVFMNDSLCGVLQFGYAMNPASQSSVVSGTAQDEYLELNRMWLSDGAPRNSESRAISYSIKYIKREYPKVKWIQSFADERCNRFGVVYQAANFDYYGEHKATFFILGDEVFHNSILTDGRQKNTPKGQLLRANLDSVKPYVLRQFRYIYWIDKRAKANCNHKQRPYPKHYLEAQSS